VKDFTLKLKRLNDRALKILEGGQTFWVVSDGASAQLVDFQREFSLHWLTCTRVLTNNVTALAQWHVSTKNSGPAVEFIIGQIDVGMNALQAPSIDRFIDLTFIIAESVAKLAGVEYFMMLFDAKGLWDKIKAVINLGKPDLAALDILLPKLEIAMEQMMLAALSFEMLVDSLTKQTGVPSDIVSINKLKAPVIGLLQELRAGMAEAAGEPTRVRFVDEGFWPPGFRGDVPDVNWKRASASSDED
jgi:hypothetical protein